MAGRFAVRGDLLIGGTVRLRMLDETTQGTSERSNTLSRWIWLTSLVVASAALVAALHAVPYIPTNDGPQAVLMAFIENHYSDPGVVFPEQVEPTWQFAHRGFSFLFLPLESVFGWREALRLTLSVIALTTAWGFAALVAVVEPARRYWGLAGFGVALGWHLYMGFFSFEWATGIGLLILAAAVAGKDRTRLGGPAVSVALGFQAICHVSAASLTGILLILIVAFRAPRGAVLREFARLALIGAPALLVLGGLAIQHDEHVKIPFTTQFVGSTLGEHLAQFPHIVSPGPSSRAWIVLAVVVAALIAAFVRWRRVSPVEKALTVGATAFLVAGVVAPLHMPGMQFLAQRFVPSAVFCALTLVPAERIKGTLPRRVLELGLLGLVLVSTWQYAGLHRSLHASSADDLAGLDQPLRRTSVQLPILLGRGMDPSLSAQVPHLDPVLHLGALYAVEHGGSIPYLFTRASAVYAFRAKSSARGVRPIPPIDPYWTVLGTEEFEHDPTYRTRIVDELSAFGMFYESIVALRARPEDIARLRLRGYEADWTSGSLFLGHFAPCSASVEIVGTAPAARIAWGLYPLPDASHRTPVPRATQHEGAPLRIDLEGVACGEIWVRLEGSEAGQRIPCREEKPGGLLVENVRRGVRARFRCTVP